MSKVALLCLLLSFSARAHTQTNWVKTFGQTVNEEILDATTDASGNIISVGYFAGTTTIGTTALTTAGNSDILVMKTTSDGTVIWAIKAGGIGPDRAFSVATDNAGNSYITGYIYNTATFGSFSVTGADRDVYAAKIDASGNFIWVQNFGGEFGDTGYGIETDNLGNVIVTGQYRGNGVFGSDTFTSTVDPNTGLTAYDFFVTKLDGSGNFLWTREANAKYDDRGMAVTVDEQNNIYVAGQFSDTITFNSTHNNHAMNAGFVIKYDASGTEIWFDKFRAAQVLLYDIKWQADRLYVTGDFKGNMQVAHQAGINNFATGGAYNILVSELNENGNLDWFSSNFSENEITSKQLALDANNDIYLAGLFKCDFTEMNQIYGNSTFLSLGYRDVHYMKYSSTGTFQWARQFGSNEDDYCSAIVMNGIDHPVMAGSFEESIVVPATNSFDYFNCDGSSVAPAPFCGDLNYTSFCYHNAIGLKDIFITDPFEISRLPLDYYQHQTSCDFDTLAPCIEVCQDTATFCYHPTANWVNLNLHQLAQPYAPLYDFLWQNGGTTTGVNVQNSEIFSVSITRQDGCAGYTDTIVVIVNPLPDAPLVSDTWNYAYHSPIDVFIDTCDMDSLFIWAITDDTLTQTLTWDTGTYVNDSTVMVNSSGSYNAFAVTEFGCTNLTSYHINVDEFAIHDTLDPYIILACDFYAPPSDTLFLCPGEESFAGIVDSNFTDPSGYIYSKYSTWLLDSIAIDTLTNMGYSFNSTWLGLLDTGWHSLDIHLVNECADSIDYYIHRDFYVEYMVLPTFTLTGPVILGNYCPGDTIVINVLTDADSITWSDNPSIIDNWGDSISTTVDFSYDEFGAFFQVTEHGVTCGGGGAYFLPDYPQPQIEIVDVTVNGGIVCPNDSLELHALSGQAWTWIGPDGDTLGTNQNCWVDLPGYYHCILMDDYGCVITSNFVEAKEYSSPILTVDPQLICEGQSTQITVVAHPLATINWLPPLSGSSTTVTVDSAGIYYCETSFCNVTQLDSAIVLLSIPQAEINAVPNTPICPGDTVTLFANGGMMNYLWNGANEGQSVLEVNTAGTYILQTENEIGCFATDTIVVEYLSNPAAPIVSDTMICSGDDLLLTAFASDSIYWFDQSGLIIGLENDLLLLNVIDPVTVIVKNKDSLCFSLSETISITLHPSSVPPVIVSDSVFCENDLIELQTADSTGSFTYTWILPDNSTSGTTELLLGNAQLIHSGTYGVFYADANCTSDTTQVTILVNPFPAADLVALTPVLICTGDTVVLEANTNATEIVWSSGILNDTLVYTDTVGIYFYTATLNACSINSDTITVAPNSITGFYEPLDTIICEGESVNFVLGTSFPTVWVDDNLDTISTSDSYATGPLFESTVYYYHVTEGGLCPTPWIPVYVTVIETGFIPDYTTSSDICLGDSLIITADQISEDYFWLSDGDTISAAPYIILLPTDKGTIFMELVTASYGCYSDTAFITVNVHDLPEFNLPDDTTICVSELLEFDMPYDYVVDYFVATDTFAVVTFTNASGCSASDTIQVHFEDCELFMPNVFTPDGDGVNDIIFFEIEKGEILSLVVVNRWGQTIFESEANSWNGIDMSGSESVAGYYFYVVRYRTVNNIIENQHGAFFLQK